MTRIFLSIILMIAAWQLSGCDADNDTPCPDSNCADYATQQEAQAAYDADPKCRGDLDSDNDGKACEHLPSGSGNIGCPSTSNCGCSGKNKNECGGHCCQWVVGSGCRCS
ncbi:hypothetical protein [Fulvivirga imtechensis]|uniref:hypothetical protein n=1 Tax=Fulvivirga imtechensis TaxID=881893 RepID=UPI001608E53F|nr:hypothetical protein [Fulvivirga imtechensis]